MARWNLSLGGALHNHVHPVELETFVAVLNGSCLNERPGCSF